MINVENAKRLIELLKTDETKKRFAMEHFFHLDKINGDQQVPVCGTASCIAGHAVLLEHPDAMITGWGAVILPGSETKHDGQEMAQEFLGLTANEAFWLFFARFCLNGFSDNPTPEMAIVAIEHLIAGGAVEDERFLDVELFDGKGNRIDVPVCD